MRKNDKKKGFTLVELLVVIAIVAVLATVSVVGYLGFTKKAQESNDITVVKQLNDILLAEEALEGKNVTMYDAMTDVGEHGYDVSKMTPTTQGYDIVWSQVDNRFVLMDNEKTVFSVDNKQYPKDYRLWKAYSADELTTSHEATKTNKTYSIYLKDGNENKKYNLPYVKVGIDQGNYANPEHTVKIFYNGSDALVDNVRPIIRGADSENEMKSKSTNADYDAYGYFSEFTVYQAAKESAHIYGNVDYLTIEEGHAVVEGKAFVKHVLSKEKSSLDIKNNSTVQNLNIVGTTAKVNIESISAEPKNIFLADDKEITNEQFSIGNKPLDAQNKFTKEPEKISQDKIYNSAEFEGGHGTENDPYIIATDSQLLKLDGFDGYLRLANDIEITTKAVGADLARFFDLSSKNSNLILDLNGHKISVSNKTKEGLATKDAITAVAIFSVSRNVTIKGNGTIDASMGTKTGYCLNVNDANAAVTIENGTYIGQSTAVQVQKGTVNILGGEFKLASSELEQSQDYIVNCIDEAYKAGTAKLNLTGGTYNFNPALNPEGEGTSYVAEGYTVNDNGDGTFTVVKAPAPTPEP